MLHQPTGQTAFSSGREREREHFSCLNYVMPNLLYHQEFAHASGGVQIIDGFSYEKTVFIKDS